MRMSAIVKVSGLITMPALPEAIPVPFCRKAYWPVSMAKRDGVQVAAEQCATHAGTLDDELALLVVHGILHVLGHDHAAADDAAAMRGREAALLRDLHWHGAPPVGFRHDHAD